MAGTVKKPITKGVAKVPVVMQLEALECGAACLTMVLAYYGKWIPLEQIRRDCGVSRDGSNAVNVLKAARHYRLQAGGFRFEPEELVKEGEFPCIIHWNFNHFVVLNGFRNNKAYINDPARGSYAVTMEEFDSAFTGVCLMFEPEEDFVPSGSKKSIMGFVKKRLENARNAVIAFMLSGAIAALMGVMSPAFSRVFMDKLLTQDHPGWVSPFLWLFAGLGIIEVVMTVFNAVYTVRITGKMAAVGNSSYIWKVLKLPMNFFSQRMAGDIQNRQLSNASIAITLAQTVAPILINCAMAVFYLAVMIRYSWLLTLVGLASIALSLFASVYASKKRINITRVAMKDEAQLYAYTVAGVDMIETIKSSGAENAFFSRWAGYQANLNTQQDKFARITQYVGSLPQFISNIANLAVLVLGVFLTMNGKFTVGMIMAFQGFLSYFNAPALMIINSGQIIQEMRTQMERLEDVMEYPEDRIFAEETDFSEDARKLSGKIEISGLEFGYAPLGEPVITDFSLKLEPGKSVAIVGASGCGKSTVSKLVSGLYKPWKGEILFDGKPLSSIPRNLFTGSVAVVDQDITIFEDTIANNIKMFDSSIEDFEVILAARDAQIHQDIMEHPDGYKRKLVEGGKDLSGGQRQRLEIARVLAQDPSVIILDEATSALDAKTEYEVIKSIKNRGVTCIVVAHRLSTIRSCDEIIVMDKGRIADRGTHKQLMESSELYRELVTSE